MSEQLSGQGNMQIGTGKAPAHGSAPEDQSNHAVVLIRAYQSSPKVRENPKCLHFAGMKPVHEIDPFALRLGECRLPGFGMQSAGETE